MLNEYEASREEFGTNEKHAYCEPVFGRNLRCTMTNFEKLFELWGNFSFMGDLFFESGRMHRPAVLLLRCDDNANYFHNNVQPVYRQAISKF